MAIPYLSDTNHYGNKISAALLDAVKFNEAPATPEAGHFYTENGVLYYRNPANIGLPVHENSLTDVSAVAPLSAVTNGRAVQLSVAEASNTSTGVMSVAHYALLNSATELNTPSSIVKRDTAGNIAVGMITATEITGLSANPTADSAAASKLYVDSVLEQSLTAALRGMDFKDSVRVALNTDVPLTSRAGTYDGIPLAAGDSILLLNQATATENGAYTITGTGLVRRADSGTETALTPGATYPVVEGTFAQNFFTFATPAGYTLGTDLLTFVNVSGVNTAIAGDGLIKNGQTFHAVGTEDRISISADAIDIAENYSGQTSITTVGEISNSEAYWAGNTIEVAYGGTGATNAFDARNQLEAQHEKFYRLGDGVDTEFVVAHQLLTYYPSVTGFYNNIALGAVDFEVINVNEIRIKASMSGSPIPQGSLVIVVKARHFSFSSDPIMISHSS